MSFRSRLLKQQQRQRGDLHRDPTDEEVCRAITSVPTHYATVYSLDFAGGSQQYVDMGNVLSLLSFGNHTSWALGCWFKVANGYSTFSGYLGRQFFGSADGRYGLNTGLDFTGPEGLTQAFNGNLDAGQNGNDANWHQLTMTCSYDGAATKFTVTTYLDGSSIGTPATGTAGDFWGTDGTSDFAMGVYQLSGNHGYLTGKMTYAWFATAVPTAGQISGLAAGTTSPASLTNIQAFWDFHENGGTTLHDVQGSSNGAFGPTTQAPTWDTDIPSQLVSAAGLLTPSPVITCAVKRAAFR